MTTALTYTRGYGERQRANEDSGDKSRRDKHHAQTQNPAPEFAAYRSTRLTKSNGSLSGLQDAKVVVGR